MTASKESGKEALLGGGRSSRFNGRTLRGKRKKRGQKKNTKVSKNLHISKKSSIFAR